MFRIADPCGIFMASLVIIYPLILILYQTPIITGTGVYILNKICIFNFFLLPQDQTPISNCIATFYLQKLTFIDLNLTPFGILLFYVFNICSALGVISHFRCSMADPGIVPKDIKVPSQIQNQIILCKKGCKRWKPQRAHHCSECKSCIMRVNWKLHMDHHCPWVNNCVGIGNMKYFMLFLAYIGIAATILSIGMIGSFFAFSSKLRINKNSPNFKEEQRVWIHLLCQQISQKFGLAFILGFIGFLIGVIFALFTFQMFKDQSTVIQENQPGVQQLKDTRGTPMLFSQNFKTIFGKDKRWWFLPVNPGVQINYMEKVYSNKQIMEINKTNQRIQPDPVYNQYDKYEKQKFKKYVLCERLIWIAIIAGFFSFVFVDIVL